MPTYEYECKSCGTVQDVFHSMTKKPRVKCLECGGSTKKLIGAGAGIIFKGSGFYETDYKNRSGYPGGGNGKSGVPKEKPAESKKEAAADTSKSDTSKSNTSSKSETKSDKN